VGSDKAALGGNSSGIESRRLFRICCLARRPRAVDTKEDVVFFKISFEGRSVNGAVGVVPDDFRSAILDLDFVHRFVLLCCSDWRSFLVSNG